MASKIWCNGGCGTQLSPKRKLIGYCLSCDETQQKILRTEVRLRGKIQELVGHEASCLDDTLFGTDRNECDVNRRRRPDFAWLWLDRAVILEIDENGGHGTKNYSKECDASWSTDMAEALVGSYNLKGHNGRALRIFIVRFNPDQRDQERPIVRLQDRVAVVCAQIRTLLTCPLDSYLPALPHLWYYFYHSNCADKITHAQGSPGIQVHGVVD